jgi:NAD(P)-dependent dehydrogenase (short-subunit alcohol dehydrogenase family)
VSGVQTRLALVTGSARGIGERIAVRLADDGFAVIGADIAPQVERRPFQRTIQVDLSCPEACELLAAECADVDVLVNNAAAFGRLPLERASVDELDWLYAVNLRAPTLLARALLPHMARRGWGRLVNISSVGAHTGGLTPTSAFYAATKGALLSLTRHLARTYGGSGVTANAIAPGWIETEMGAAARRAGVTEERGTIPLDRWGKPSEVASVVAFLVSDDASYLTGATLDVAGGWVMR